LGYFRVLLLPSFTISLDSTLIPVVIFQQVRLEVGGAMVIACNASMFGFMLGTIVTNKTLALEIAPLFFLPFLLFSGFTTNSSSLKSNFDGLDEMD
jgi:hypothetical protein